MFRKDLFPWDMREATEDLCSRVPSEIGTFLTWVNDYRKRAKMSWVGLALMAELWPHLHVSRLPPKYVQYHEIRLRQEGDEEVIFLPPEVCPPLIEEWRAEAAHQRMRANKQEAGKHSRSVKEALLRGGYILCGFCGRPMYCSTHPGKGAPVYHCRSVREQYEGIILGCQSRTHVAHTVIDDVVWQAIVDYFSDPSWLERILARERDRETSEAENKIKQIAELEETLASKEAAADHLVRLAANITSESMREKLQGQMNELVLSHQR